MTPRRRMLLAIDRGPLDEVPVVICYLGIFLRDHWQGITDKPWWALRSPDIADRLEVDRGLLGKLDLDWIPCSMCQPESWRRSHSIRVENGRVLLVGEDGTRDEIRKPPPGGDTLYIAPEPVIEDVSEIEDAIPVRDAAELRRQGRLDYVKMLRRDIGSDRFLVASMVTPFWKALSQSFGFRSMMLNLRRDPRLVERALERITEDRGEMIRAYARAGVDGIWLEECLASAAEISPADYRRFVLPYNRELVEVIHDEGIRCIYYPCGDVTDRMESIIETGTDCISLEESKKGFRIEISEVDRAVSGRACLFGNLSSDLLERGSDRELTAGIGHQIEVGRRNGRFVMSLGSPVTPGTGVQRVAEYVRISREESR